MKNYRYTNSPKNPDARLISNHPDNRPYWATDKEQYYRSSMLDYEGTRADYTSQGYSGELTTKNRAIPFDMSYNPATNKYQPSRPQYWLEQGQERFTINPTKVKNYKFDTRSSNYPESNPFQDYNVPDYDKPYNNRLDPLGAEVSNYDNEAQPYNSHNIKSNPGQYDSNLYYPGTKDPYNNIEYNGFGDVTTNLGKMSRNEYISQVPRTKNVGIMAPYKEHNKYDLVHVQKKSCRPEPQYSLAQKDFLRRKFIASQPNYNGATMQARKVPRTVQGEDLVNPPQKQKQKNSDDYDPRETFDCGARLGSVYDDYTQSRRNLGDQYVAPTWNNIDMEISIQNDPRMDIAKDYSFPLWTAQDFFDLRKNGSFQNRKGGFT